MCQELNVGRVQRVGSDSIYIETLYYLERHMTGLAVS